MQDRDLNEYRPSTSTTSKHLSCSHQLCQLGPNCQSPKQTCPYIVNYYSADTSSSGFLVEDTLHLAGNDDKSNTSVQASVIIGSVRLIYHYRIRFTNFISERFFKLGFLAVNHIIIFAICFLISAVGGSKAVVTWMELLLMVLWVLD